MDLPEDFALKVAGILSETSVHIPCFFSKKRSQSLLKLESLIA